MRCLSPRWIGAGLRCTAAGLTLFGTAAAGHSPCSGLLPDRTNFAERPIRPEDLVRLRDIGSPDSSNLAQPTPMGISPDGRKVAFILTRADPGTNETCRGLVIVDLDKGFSPRVVDIGGEPILEQAAYRGFLVTVGAPKTVQPRWSPDGQALAYLRRDGGVTQVWLAYPDGKPAKRLTRSPVGVDNFGWLDAKTVIYTSRPGLLTLRADNAHEALRGIHYDDRIATNRGIVPQTPAGLSPSYTLIDSETAAERPAGNMQAKLFDRVAAGTLQRAGLEPSGSLPLSPAVLWGSIGSGTKVRCTDAVCHGGIVGVFQWPGQTDIYYLRREGWAKDTLSFYRWRPDISAPPKLLWHTARLLLGCSPASTKLLCLDESSTTPRKMVAIDPASGRSTLVFDPNPEFHHLLLGSVERLFWRNDRGLEARGDLVLPRGKAPHGGWPLIVTQYHSDGFLRGATGDEYPIFAFAARGFAVLSIEQTPIVALEAKGLRTFDEVNAYNARNWAERRSLLSSLLIGVRQVLRRGLVDPRRIGLTGLSDGASTVEFALINSNEFAAAAISTCCVEPWTVMAYGGTAYADRMHRLGFPPASRPDPAFWTPMSLALNAAEIDTPLLMQLSDDEYLLALEAFTALRENGKPVDMYVFPGEHHIKSQPSHRLAIYQRNLDWFAFWLKGEQDLDPSKTAQYDRWRALRRARVH